MGKKYEIRKIKSKRSYTFKEIADRLSIHERTVQSWHTGGLVALEGSNNPYLVMGTEVQNYIKLQRLKNRVVLKDNEFYCMGCKKAVVPEKIYKYMNGIRMGGNKQSVRLNGVCPACKRKVNKFTTREQFILEGKSNTIRALEHPRKD